MVLASHGLRHAHGWRSRCRAAVASNPLVISRRGGPFPSRPSAAHPVRATASPSRWSNWCSSRLIVVALGLTAHHEVPAPCLDCVGLVAGVRRPVRERSDRRRPSRGHRVRERLLRAIVRAIRIGDSDADVRRLMGAPLGEWWVDPSSGCGWRPEPTIRAGVATRERLVEACVRRGVRRGRQVRGSTWRRRGRRGAGLRNPGQNTIV